MTNSRVWRTSRPSSLFDRRTRLTTPARTVVDCFKYRNKIGIDVALEALREYRRARRSINDLIRAAEIVRVRNVIRPYLESVLA